MIIKLTNATPEYDGQPILLNTRHILSVFETTQKVNEAAAISVTNIYMVTQQSWSVKETVEEIERML